MANQTEIRRFRVFLDTAYDVEPWPFHETWNAILDRLPEELPGKVTDFDIFLPDDHMNRAHGLIDREESSVQTEMAIYRQDEALIVLMRCHDGRPLTTRFAPPNRDGAGIILMSDERRADALYAGVDPDSRSLVCVWRGLQPDESEEVMESQPLPGDGPAVAVRAIRRGGYWAAGFRVPLLAVPGLEPGADRVRFTAGRIWGETFEPLGWATSIMWAPQPREMGTLHLVPRPTPRKAGLRRADLLYNCRSETGELVFQLAELPPDQTVDVKLSLNRIDTRHRCSGELRMNWQPDNGDNVICIKVGARPTAVIHFEKWSGHQLFVRYPSDRPLPEKAMMRDAFARWHERSEKIYVAAGTWSGHKPSAQRPYGVDHECAFVMEPYALACLYLDDQPIYRQRVHEACERLLREQDSSGIFYCYHHGSQPVPFQGGAFAHGSASEALVLGYRVLRDQRYLDAAIRAADAYKLYPLENNTNYMAFVLWHLCELYEITREPRYLDQSIWYCRHGLIRGMNPSGAWPGHNYYTGYGYITLKGMAKLLRVLPSDHEFYDTLKERVLRCTNQMLSRQRVNGWFDARNRMYFGYQQTVGGLYDVARALPVEVARCLTPALIAMFYGHVGGTPWEPAGLDIALMARHVSESPRAVQP